MKCNQRHPEMRCPLILTIGIRIARGLVIAGQGSVITIDSTLELCNGRGEHR